MNRPLLVILAAVTLDSVGIGLIFPILPRLLAGTGKSGCLEVTGTSRSGEVWLGDGAIVAGVVSDAPHATEPSDVLFELLRLAEGHFVFDDGAELADEHRGEPVAVDEALGDAQALVERWADIEAVVPSMDAWLSLVPELAGDDGPGRLGGARLEETCGADWGLFTTVTDNLAKFDEIVGSLELGTERVEVLAARSAALRGRLEDAPKTRAWRMRAKVGRRKRWYEVPEEVHR